MPKPPKQQETVFDIGLQHTRGVQAGGTDEAGHVHKGPHVFQWGWRVHHDQGAILAGIHPEIATEAGIGAGCARRLRLHAMGHLRL